MELGYYTNHLARIVVEERLNHSKREPVISDRIQPIRMLNAAVDAASIVIQRFIKNVNVQMRRWVDTQTACTWRDLSLANC